MLKKTGDIQDFQAGFDFLNYFEGVTHGSGLFEDRFGRRKKTFTLVMEGCWSGGELVLDEKLAYADGQTDRRTWRIARGEGGRFSGTTVDVQGTGAGRHESRACVFDYRMRLAIGSRMILFDMNDVFYSVGTGMVLNRTAVRKFGLRVGQVLTVFRKA